MNQEPNTLPETGFKGFSQTWRDDLSAAVSVSLVALPLGLGIALASGAPPMAGIISAIVGGLITTFFRGSHVAINGPTAGLIVVVLGGIQTLGHGGISGFRYVLAAIVVAGIIQMLLGITRMGRLGDVFPSSVAHGMLAAIGIIIFGKQIHVAFGIDDESFSALGTLLNIPQSMFNLNPFTTLIALLGIGILIIYPTIKYRLVQVVPAPIWVIAVAIPLVFIFNFFEGHNIEIFNHLAYVGPEYLINIPDNLIDSIIFPDFGKINTGAFWLTAIAITLVGSLESLISTKAIDKLDPLNRRTNLNKDLFAVGLSTVVSGLIGGLPVITVIVRSSVNVNHGAKSKWSNFFHGGLLLALVFLFPMIIQSIPKAALAALLVFTGYKLASPKVFQDAWMKGWEQFVILMGTIISILAFNLLWGIVIGIIVTLAIHYFRVQLSLKTFVRHIISPYIKSVSEKEKQTLVKVKGIANFLIIPHLMHELRKLPRDHDVIVDFSHARLVGSTILDLVYERHEKHNSSGSHFEIIGLDVHKSSSSHPHALHILDKPTRAKLSGRQAAISNFSMTRGYGYKPEVNWDTSMLKSFEFFQHKLLEYTNNRIRGQYQELGIKWEISDVTYDEGVLVATDVHHITVQVLRFPVEITQFTITNENIYALKGGELYKKFQSSGFRRLLGKYFLKGDNNLTLKEVFTHKLVQFLTECDSHYIESIGNEMLIYRRVRLSSAQEIIKLHDFSEEFCQVLMVNNKVLDRVVTD